MTVLFRWYQFVKKIESPLRAARKASIRRPIDEEADMIEGLLIAHFSD